MKRKTTLTLDDMQMVAEYVQDAVKDGITQILPSLVEAVEGKTREIVRDELKDQIGTLPTKEELFSRLDLQANEQITIREEQIMMQHQSARLTHRVENLEKHS